DGASFTARLDLRGWLRAQKLCRRYQALYADAESVTVEITQGGHSCHEYTMDVVSRRYGSSEAADAQLSEVEARILQDARDRARVVYRALEREYEHQTSDEQVIEAIRANEYEFDADGDLAVIR